MLSLALVVLKDKFVVLGPGLGLEPWVLALSPCQVFANVDMLFPNTQNGWGGHSTEMATVLCIFHSQQRLFSHRVEFFDEAPHPHRARMSNSLLETLVFLKCNSACV